MACISREGATLTRWRARCKQGCDALVAYYFTGIARSAAAVPASGDAVQPAKVVAAVSLLAWFGVVYFGCIIMYNDTLLYALGK